MADDLGARQVNVVEGLGVTYEDAALIDALGGFVGKASARGLRVSIEPMPISSVAILAHGWRIVQDTDHADFGLTFDSGHFWRAEPDHDLLRSIPAEKIFEVQLADGKSEFVDDIFNDLLYHRLLPGDGDFNLKQTVAVLREMGAYRS